MVWCGVVWCFRVCASPVKFNRTEKARVILLYLVTGNVEAVIALPAFCFVIHVFPRKNPKTALRMICRWNHRYPRWDSSNVAVGHAAIVNLLFRSHGVVWCVGCGVVWCLTIGTYTV